MRYVEFCSQFNTMPQVRRTDGEQFLVYFLMLGDTIVYVGKSSESGVFSRLKSHQQDKEYDSYFVINGLESDAEAMEIEKGFISLIRPKYNKADARVNLRAIMKVINLVTSSKSEKQFKSIKDEPMTVEEKIKVLQARIRADQSNLRRGHGNEDRVEARLAQKYAELQDLRTEVSEKG